jgi:hypothetical protein
LKLSTPDKGALLNVLRARLREEVLRRALELMLEAWPDISPRGYTVDEVLERMSPEKRAEWESLLTVLDALEE